jgi:hypothetical protein
VRRDGTPVPEKKITKLISYNLRLTKSQNQNPRKMQRTENKTKNKQNKLRGLVRKGTIPTERPPLVNETKCQLLWIEGCRVVSAADPLPSLISVF